MRGIARRTYDEKNAVPCCATYPFQFFCLEYRINPTKHGPQLPRRIKNIPQFTNLNKFRNCTTERGRGASKVLTPKRLGQMVLPDEEVVVPLSDESGSPKKGVDPPGDASGPQKGP